MPIRVFIRQVALLLVLLVSWSAWGAKNPFRVEVIGPQIAAGEAGTIQVILRVPAGHHVYRDMMGVETLDAGGLEMGEADFPPGFEKPDPANPDLTREMYDMDVYIDIPVKAPADGRDREALLLVRYQGCRDNLCYMPEREEHPVKVTVKGGERGATSAPPGGRALVQALGGKEPPADPVHLTVVPAQDGMVAVKVLVDESWHVNRAFMALAFPPGDSRAESVEWSIGVPELPPGTPFVDPATGFERIDLEGTFEMRVPVTGPPGTHELSLDVGFQACRETLCLMPAWESLDFVLTVPGAATVALPPASAPAPAAAPPEPAGDDAFSRARAAGTLPLILLVFVAGVGVSFTPCVLPMVPITIGIIGASSAGSRARGVALAATYVAGLASVYTLLGVVAGFTGMAFGSWLSNVWVVGGIAGLFFLMGLAMFGLFDLGVPSAVQTRLSQYGGAGFGGAVVVGMVGALVAGPCSGPVLVSIIALIGKQGEVALGALLMAIFSLGMGIIFLVAGAFSSTLLRPGPWMDTVKKSFGLVMWAGALYFASPHLSDRATALVGAAMLLATAVYAWPQEEMGEGFWIERTRKLYSIVGGLVGAYLLIGVLVSEGFILPGVTLSTSQGAVAEHDAIAWSADEAGALERARREGRLVMIDFTAEWCAACKELEHLTYTDPEVIAASREMVPVMVDATRDSDSAVKALLEKHGVAGLPTVKFLRPDGTAIDELTVTGFLDADAFLERMKAASARVEG